MPKNTSENTETESEATETVGRTEPMDIGPEYGGNLLAAWEGAYNLFGARFANATPKVGRDFDVLEDGIVLHNITFNGNVDPQALLEDISGRTRRVDLLSAWPILHGENPAPFATSLDMTKWMQQYFRKPGEDGKSPQYVKDAIATYKREQGFPPRRGRPKKSVRLENLGSIDVTQLAGVDVSELEKLQAVINESIATREAAEASA